LISVLKKLQDSRRNLIFPNLIVYQVHVALRRHRSLNSRRGWAFEFFDLFDFLEQKGSKSAESLIS